MKTEARLTFRHETQKICCLMVFGRSAKDTGRIPRQSPIVRVGGQPHPTPLQGFLGAAALPLGGSGGGSPPEYGGGGLGGGSPPKAKNINNK